MTRTRTLLAFAIIQFLAITALAQTAPAAEFGRASGGQIDTVVKTPRPFSGTLSLTRGTGLFGGQRYDGSLGGELVRDRMWFFASAAVTPRVQMANVTAQPVDWSAVTASFRTAAPQITTTTTTPYGALPSSFLSLRSTNVLSDRMTLDVSISRSGAR